MSKKHEQHNPSNQASYFCEGFVKEVTAPNDDGKVVFKLEPATPFLFEKKTDDGKTKKLLLFVDDAKTPNAAKIYEEDQEFFAPSKCDFCSMLIAKANRLKIRVTSNLAPTPFSVEELTVL